MQISNDQLVKLIHQENYKMQLLKNHFVVNDRINAALSLEGQLRQYHFEKQRLSDSLRQKCATNYNDLMTSNSEILSPLGDDQDLSNFSQVDIICMLLHNLSLEKKQSVIVKLQKARQELILTTQLLSKQSELHQLLATNRELQQSFEALNEQSSRLAMYQSEILRESQSTTMRNLELSAALFEEKSNSGIVYQQLRTSVRTNRELLDGVRQQHIELLTLEQQLSTSKAECDSYKKSAHIISTQLATLTQQAAVQDNELLQLRSYLFDSVTTQQSSALKISQLQSETAVVNRLQVQNNEYKTRYEKLDAENNELRKQLQLKQQLTVDALTVRDEQIMQADELATQCQCLAREYSELSKMVDQVGSKISGKFSGGAANAVIQIQQAQVQHSEFGCQTEKEPAQMFKAPPMTPRGADKAPEKDDNQDITEIKTNQYEQKIERLQTLLATYEEQIEETRDKTFQMRNASALIKQLRCQLEMQEDQNFTASTKYEELKEKFIQLTDAYQDIYKKEAKVRTEVMQLRLQASKQQAMLSAFELERRK